VGFLLAVAASVVVAVIQYNLFWVWFRSLSEQPDFLDNGLSYLALGYVLLVPAIDLALFVAAFAIAIPVSFSSRLHDAYRPFRVTRWVIITATLVAVVFALFLGVGGTHLLFPLTAVPAMAAMALGVWYLARRANDQLAGARGSTGQTTE
jgi:hypothetical protein